MLVALTRGSVTLDDVCFGGLFELLKKHSALKRTNVQLSPEEELKSIMCACFEECDDGLILSLGAKELHKRNESFLEST